MDNNDYVMWLSRTLSQSNRKTVDLINFFGSPKEVFDAERNDYLGVRGMTEAVAEKLSDSKKNIEFWKKEIDNMGIEYVSFFDERYPILLNEINDAPCGLYVKGRLPGNDERCVSIIGARRCSEYGRLTAYGFATKIASRGVWIISGMARGIDSISHKGAISAGGKTVAVLGFGHNKCYPAENRDLMNKISENGCVISEYPPDTEPEVYFFPQRNRIIAGMSEALIVVEAGKKSGTLITVDRALDYGRTVLAVPSNITSASGEGTNDLIKQGCPMITNAQDVFFELGMDDDEDKKEKQHETKMKCLSDDENKILGLLSYEPLPFEKIVKNSGKDIQDVQYILTLLEINGFAEKLPGNRFTKKI